MIGWGIRMKQNRGWILFIIAVILILIAGCRDKAAEDRCDHDGFPIQPLYAIYFSLQDGSEKTFCSIVCASISFQQLKNRVDKVMVIDEASGARIPASEALFVESDVVTVPHVGNSIHVFENREDALKHLIRFKGRWIENPFTPPTE